MSNPSSPTIEELQAQIAALAAEYESLKGSTAAASSTKAPIVPDPVHTIADIIGISDFLPEARSDIELGMVGVEIVSKKARQTMSSSDKATLYGKFVKGTGSTTKFKAISTLQGLDDIMTIDGLVQYCSQRLLLVKHITAIAAGNVFMILKFDKEGELIHPDLPEGKPINLLTDPIMPKLEQIEDSTRFYHQRGSSFHLENLKWTYDAIMASCDKDLQLVLQAKMMKYKDTEHFGPFLLYFLTQQMTEVNPKTIRAITVELSSIRIVDIEGQSISNVVAKIRATRMWLEMVGSLPHDFMTIVMTIFETCTVPQFELFVSTFLTNAELSSKELEVENVLEIFEGQYRKLVLAHKWDAIEASGSAAFSAFSMQRTVGGNGGRGGGANQRGQGGSGKTMPPWFKIAPEDGEPTTRSFGGETWIWCAKCGRWLFGSKGHHTADHKKGFSKRGSGGRGGGGRNGNSGGRGAPQRGANNAIVEESPLSGLTRAHFFRGGL